MSCVYIYVFVRVRACVGLCACTDVVWYMSMCEGGSENKVSDFVYYLERDQFIN